MTDKITELTELEEYKKMAKIKKDLDNKTLSLNELSLEEIEDVNKIYSSEVYKLSQEVQLLDEKNKKLKELLEKR